MDGVGGSGSGACPFLRRSSTKRSLSTMADNHRSTSPDNLFVSRHDHYDNEHTAQRRRPNGLVLPPRPLGRFEGDGYDFRRPVTTSTRNGTAGSANGSGNAANVIDLTEEDESQDTSVQATREPTPAAVAGSSRAQRPPRFGRNIIDVESEDEEEEPHARTSGGPNLTNLFPPRDHHNPNLHPRFSYLRRPHRPTPAPAIMDYDLEFIEERPRLQPQTDRSHTPLQRSITPFPGGMGDTIDLTGDDNDDVVHLNTRPLPGGLNHDIPAVTGGVGTRSEATIADLFERAGANRLRARIGGMLGQGGLLAQRLAHEQITHDRHRNTGTNNNQQRRDGMPRVTLARMAPPAGVMIAMDYATPAFEIGFAGGNEPTQPKYEPPPDVGPGFTRSPEENEAVVCPNCGDELAVGERDDKQEVFVIKKCGHAYCGDCAKNHTKPTRSSKKGKGKAAVTDGAPNFNKCVVDGCKESATARSFVHVFLGS